MTELRKFTATAQDVAKLAGVSRSAVSRCFSGAGNVSKEKRERIFEAAKELGYRPNAIARSLTGQKTDLVALITTEHLSYRSNVHLSEMTLCLAEAGKRALVVPVGDNTTIDESSLRALDYKVDAIVIMGGSVSGEIVSFLSAAKVPLFLFGREHEGGASVGISCDNALGGAMAARFFHRAGRSQMAYVGKHTRTFSDRNRRHGFADEVRRLGQTFLCEADDESTYEGGRRAAGRMFSSAEVPDAIFCFNDTMAFGVLQAAQDFKFRVPKDVAVIGFDDQPMAGWHAFDLTTVGYDPYELASLATAKIIQALDQPFLVPQSYLLEPKLVIRGTTP